MTTRDLTVAATYKRLIALGYSPTSADNPRREAMYDRYRRTTGELARDPAAIQCFPTRENGGDDNLDDLEKRQVAVLIVTGYGLADPKQAKTMLDVLNRHDVISGPYYVTGFGDRHYPLQWNDAEPIYDEQFKTRLAFASDDRCVIVRQAINAEYAYGRNQYGIPMSGVVKPTDTHIIPLDADWKQGSILDVPRHKLPELLRANVRDLIEEIELARWGARPAANSKEAA